MWARYVQGVSIFHVSIWIWMYNWLTNWDVAQSVLKTILDQWCLSIPWPVESIYLLIWLLLSFVLKIHQNTTSYSYNVHFSVCQRPSSSEAGNSFSSSWHDKNLTCRESGHMRDWVDSCRHRDSWLVDLPCRCVCFDEFLIWNLHQPNESVYWNSVKLAFCLSEHFCIENIKMSDICIFHNQNNGWRWLRDGRYSVLQAAV